MITTPILSGQVFPEWGGMNHPDFRKCFDLLNDIRYPSTPIEGEHYEIVISDSGRVIWRSGQTELIRPTERRINLRMRERSRYTVAFNYLRVWRGIPYGVTQMISVTTRFLQKSQIRQFLLSFPNAQYASSIATARRVVAKRISSLNAELKSRANTKTSRPNPEQIETPYLIMTEKRLFGNHSVAAVGGLRTLYRREWTGVRTPGWGKLRPSQIPVNPHSVKLRVVDADGPLVEHYRVLDGPEIGDFQLVVDKHTLNYPAPAELSGHLPQAREKAFRRLIEAVHGDVQSNLAVSFAQIGKTMNLIIDYSNRIRGSLVNLKKGNLSGAAKTLWAGKTPRYQPGQRPSVSKSTAQNWLAFQYGWKPLLNDIHGALEALAEFTAAFDFVRRVTSSATHSLVEVQALKNAHVIHASEDAGFNKVSTTSRCKFVLYYQISDPLKTFMAQTGFTNPVNLAWELLPFSFVVDWFLPVGPYLETLSSWDGLAFKDGSETNFTKQEATSAITFNSTKFVGGGTTEYRHRSHYHRIMVELGRIRLTSFPSQNLPEIRYGLSSVHRAANAIALMKAVF